MTRGRDLTRDRDIERVLEHWLTDGVNEMPDRVYQSIFDRVERQPQALAPRLLRRLPQMNGSLRWIAAAAAVLLIAVVGFAFLGGRSGSGVGGPQPTPSPSASSAAVVPSPTPAWDTSQTLCGETGCGGPLTAGTYTSTGLKPAVTYTLNSPWVNQRDWAQFFMLYPDTPANRTLAASGGYPPYILVLPGPNTVSPSRGCAESATDEVEVDAAGLARYLAEQDGLVTTTPIPVRMSGMTGLQVDVTPGSTWTGCLPGAPLGETVSPTDGYRFIALDSPDGHMLLIRLRAPAGFDTFTAAAGPTVNSFEFDFSQVPSPSP